MCFLCLSALVVYNLTKKSSYTWNIVCFHGYYRSKNLRFSFLQERTYICLCNSPIWFDFLKLSLIQEGLKHPCGRLSFLQNKIFKIARFNCVKKCLQRITFPNCPTLLWIRHFECHIAKQFGNLAASRTRIKTTLFARSFRRRFFAYHYAVNQPHTIIIVSWFSIPLVLKCAAKILKIGLQIKI